MPQHHSHHQVRHLNETRQITLLGLCRTKFAAT